MACLWYECITTVVIDEDYICGVCHAPFNHPIVWPCGHTFCKTCTDESFNVTSACPECKQTANQIPTTKNIVMARAIDNKLECHCLAMPDCKWVGKVGMFHEHICACDEIVTICDNVGCEFEEKRASVKLHQSECVYNSQILVTCPLCNNIMPRCEVTGHMMACQHRAILCPVKDCQNPVTIQELDQHLETPGHGRRMLEQLMCSLFDRSSRIIEPDVKATSASKLIWNNSDESSISPVVQIDGIAIYFSRKDGKITMTVKSCNTRAFWLVWVADGADAALTQSRPIKIIEGQTYQIGTTYADVINIQIRQILLV